MTGESGVTVWKQDVCDDGYRLYSSRNGETARLIEPSGRELHRWDYPQGQSWHYAEILPDGHLVAIIKDVMILELDWDSQLVWKDELRAHHDFARLANDHTLIVSRRDLPHPWANEGTLACDILVERTPDGRTVWEWKVEAHADELVELAGLRLPPSEKFWDFPHINTVEVLPDSPTGRADGRFREGNLLVCGRHIDTIWTIDRATGRIVWAWGPGELLGPHMPTMLPGGTILVYDNGQNVETGVRGFTRILELDPLAGEILWQYQADPPESFYSPSRGSSERLPNGNTLIAESDTGRLLEVTPAGEIVWEFLNPDTTPKGGRVALYRTVYYPRPFINALRNAHDGA